ncbi:winged-helix domain-containing protein [Thermodesulfobacteriota bacterium]
MLKIAVISDNIKFLDIVKPVLSKFGDEVTLYSKLNKDLSESIIDAKVNLIIIDFFTNPSASQLLVENINRGNELNNLHVIAVFDKPPGDSFEFNSGIDDFIFKDSFKREIALRIKLFEWKEFSVDSSGKIVSSGFVIDIDNYEVSFNGKMLTLTFKEFELLKFLIAHPNKVYSRDALLNQVWGYNYYGGTRTVDVHIRRLRSKIGIEMDKYLKTIRNVGYKFEDNI